MVTKVAQLLLINCAEATFPLRGNEICGAPTLAVIYFATENFYVTQSYSYV